MTRKGWIALAVFATLALLPPLALAAGDKFLVSLGARVLIYALAAVSLDLILGFGGMVSFGHAAYLGIGGYVVGILAFHQMEGDWFGTSQALIAWPLAVAASALAALAFGALSLRTGGVHFIMITLAFAQMVFFLFVSLEYYGGDDGLMVPTRSSLPGLRLGDDVTFYYVCLALLAAFTLLCARIVNSRFGMVLRGARQNERRMASLGFPVYRYRLAAFVIAGAGAGLAGCLYVNHGSYASPDMMAWTKSGEIMVMVILGGMGTLIGPILGAATLLMLESQLSGLTEHWMAILGPFLLLVVLFARRGLHGLLMGRAPDA